MSTDQVFNNMDIICKKILIIKITNKRKAKSTLTFGLETIHIKLLQSNLIDVSKKVVDFPFKWGMGSI